MRNNSHSAPSAMAAAIKKHYWWPTIAADCKATYDHCHICKRTKHRSAKPYGNLQRIHVVTCSARRDSRAPGHHNVIWESAPVHATLAQPAAGADSLKDLRARRAQDHACLAVYILKVYILKMTLLVPV